MLVVCLFYVCFTFNIQGVHQSKVTAGKPKQLDHTLRCNLNYPSSPSLPSRFPPTCYSIYIV